MIESDRRSLVVVRSDNTSVPFPMHVSHAVGFRSQSWSPSISGPSRSSARLDDATSSPVPCRWCRWQSTRLATSRTTPTTPRNRVRRRVRWRMPHGNTMTVRRQWKTVNDDVVDATLQVVSRRESHILDLSSLPSTLLVLYALTASCFRVTTCYVLTVSHPVIDATS